MSNRRFVAALVALSLPVAVVLVTYIAVGLLLYR